MSKLAKALTAAAGNAGESLYVEDVFSTYLYEGFGSTQTITNGIDLSGEGGLVWLKNRDGATNHRLYTTDLYSASNSNLLQTNLTSGGSNTGAFELQSFNSNGFALGYSGGAYSESNAANTDYVSWTFRKAEKFFDVVTWTGDGTGARTISHNLNGTVGALFMKATNADMQWFSYHNGLTNAQFLELNATTSAVSSANAWNNTTPTSSEFTVGSYGNISGRTYVAYLFASDAGGFGDDGSESIIKCGSYTGNGGTQEINLGFEPQWLLVKSSTQTDSWFLTDTMRGMPNNAPTPYLLPNMSNAEAEASAGFFPQATATGFKIGASGSVNASGQTFIYIAIRRPMKTPESGTEVFNSLAYTGDGASTRDFDLGMTVDAYFQACRSSSTYDFKNLTARLTAKGLHTAGTGTEFTTNTSLDVQDGLRAIGFENTLNQSGETYIINGFKRATGFFDVVAYSGTGVAGSTVAHNLGIAPELMIVKARNVAIGWQVYTKPTTATNVLILETTAAAGESLSRWNYTEPTDAVFTLGNSSGVNSASYNYIAYLFASVAGVSKVGSYTGTGANLNVDCGFSAGARFILIKRTDSTGDWYVWDSSRGIVAGNDPYLLLNSTAAEVTTTDYIDPLASGFTVTSSAPAALNASGGSYIFLAIA